MQNHLNYTTRSFLGVYRPHPAIALLSQDIGSIKGNKSYAQDQQFLGQPLNLLSKNHGFCLTAVAKAPVAAFPGDNPYEFMPCNGNPLSFQDKGTYSTAGSVYNIQQERREVEGIILRYSA